MEKDLKILQKNITIDHESMKNCLILIFMFNGKVKGTSIIQLPEWFKFWSEEYRYYPFCHN